MSWFRMKKKRQEPITEREQRIMSLINNTYGGDATAPLSHDLKQRAAKISAIRMFVMVEHYGYDRVSFLLNSDRNEIGFCKLVSDGMMRDVARRDVFRELEKELKEIKEYEICR